MGLGDLADFLRQNTDFYFVTDIKDNNVEGCRLIAEYCPDLLDRFIVQIYHSYEYDEVRYLGFDNVIFTLYLTTKKEREIETLKYFADRNVLVGFTFWDYWADDEDFLNGISQIGVPMYVHTVNDPTRMEQYYEKGITAIYTDLIDGSALSSRG